MGEFPLGLDNMKRKPLVNDYNISLQNSSSIARASFKESSATKLLIKMDFTRDFSVEEVVPWLRSHGFSLETYDRIGKLSKRSDFSAQPHVEGKPIQLFGFFCYLQENDNIDGQDLFDITQQADELRHYFPNITERLKFKK